MLSLKTLRGTCTDLLTYNFSFMIYISNFLSRRQCFFNIGKYPSKVQQVRTDPFLGKEVLKRSAMFHFYTPVFRRDVLWYGYVRPSVRPSDSPSVRPTLRPGLRPPFFRTFLIHALTY